MYECVCDAGWFGVNCEADINECASNPCIHGVCWAPELSVWQCECFDGYEGITCANDIVECASNPCIHGQCSELKIAEFNCSCDVGYTGVQCDIDIDECASEPCGQGVCTQPDIDSFQCDCLPGWTGEYCTEEIDECASSPCVNGTCVDGDNGFTCNCFPGYDGTLCNIDPRVNFDRCEHWPQDPEVPGCDNRQAGRAQAGTVLTTRNCLKQCTCTLNKKGSKAKFKCKKFKKKSQAMKLECQVCLNTPVDCSLKFIEGFVKCLERLDGSPMDEYDWERNMKNKDDAIVRDICFATID